MVNTSRIMKKTNRAGYKRHTPPGVQKLRDDFKRTYHRAKQTSVRAAYCLHKPATLPRGARANENKVPDEIEGDEGAPTFYKDDAIVVITGDNPVLYILTQDYPEVSAEVRATRCNEELISPGSYTMSTTEVSVATVDIRFAISHDLIDFDEPTLEIPHDIWFQIMEFDDGPYLRPEQPLDQEPQALEDEDPLMLPEDVTEHDEKDCDDPDRGGEMPCCNAAYCKHIRVLGCDGECQRSRPDLSLGIAY